jgi:hypothetical protein
MIQPSFGDAGSNGRTQPLQNRPSVKSRNQRQPLQQGQQVQAPPTPRPRIAPNPFDASDRQTVADGNEWTRRNFAQPTVIRGQPSATASAFGQFPQQPEQQQQQEQNGLDRSSSLPTNSRASHASKEGGKNLKWDLSYWMNMGRDDQEPLYGDDPRHADRSGSRSVPFDFGTDDYPSADSNFQGSSYPPQQGTSVPVTNVSFNGGNDNNFLNRNYNMNNNNVNGR